MARKTGSPPKTAPAVNGGAENGKTGEAATRRIALVLQGGGALGSYQAGVFEALAEGGYRPDWLAGVSIGAVNSAIIAGNPPELRVERLRQFWEDVSQPTAHWPPIPSDFWRMGERHLGAITALLFGQPGFYRPRHLTDWLVAGPPVSFYDTTLLRNTLERLVDFDRINHGRVRLSVGAVNAETGNLVFFDSHNQKLGPEHVMASGALPPGFPPVEIDGVPYWDGGLVSNTPLQYVLDDEPRVDTLAFQVDLFSARGKRPENLEEANEREKDIRYSSRTRAGTTSARDKHNARRLIAHLLERLPPELADDPAVKLLRKMSCRTEMDVVHLIYQPDEPQGASKDFEFSRGTMVRRWTQGREDAAATLAAAPWRHVRGPHPEGVRVFDVLADHRRPGGPSIKTP